MEKEWILISEYCKNTYADTDFINSLEREGLLSIRMIDQVQYFHESQLDALELFSRLHYELSVNIEGIDIIQNLLFQIEEINKELIQLRRELSENE